MGVPTYASSIENIRRIFLNNEMFLFLGWDPCNSAFNILESLQTSSRGEMSRYTIVCLMVFGYFFSSSIVQNKCVSKLFTFMFGLYIPCITLLLNEKYFLHYFLCSKTINDYLVYEMIWLKSNMISGVCFYSHCYFQIFWRIIALHARCIPIQ